MTRGCRAHLSLSLSGGAKNVLYIHIHTLYSNAMMIIIIVTFPLQTFYGRYCICVALCAFYPTIVYWYIT